MELEICDAHVHLWDRDDAPMAPATYLVDDLHADIAPNLRVTKVVYVECGTGYRPDGPAALAPVGETEWVTTATSGELVKAIVGFADLTLGHRVDEVLEEHEAAAEGRFRGVRHSTAWDPDPRVPNASPEPDSGVMLTPQFTAGLSVLKRRGLTFDAWVYFHQLPEVLALAQEHAELPIVLNHFGGPLAFGPYARRPAEVDEMWRRSMAELATCENVVVKLGGIGMGLLGSPRGSQSPRDAAEQWRSRFGYVIDMFGVHRCMFESNFPVDRRALTYEDVWRTFERLSQGLTAAERSALHHDTAVRVYRIKATDTDRAPAIGQSPREGRS